MFLKFSTKVSYGTVAFGIRTCPAEPDFDAIEIGTVKQLEFREQWQIQDFSQVGAPTIQAAPTHDSSCH